MKCFGVWVRTQYLNNLFEWLELKRENGILAILNGIMQPLPG